MSGWDTGGRGEVLAAPHDLAGDPGIGLQELERQVLQLPRMVATA
jgi:hypothetical protein